MPLCICREDDESSHCLQDLIAMQTARWWIGVAFKICRVLAGMLRTDSALSFLVDSALLIYSVGEKLSSLIII